MIFKFLLFILPKYIEYLNIIFFFIINNILDVTYILKSRKTEEERFV